MRRDPAIAENVVTFISAGIGSAEHAGAGRVLTFVSHLQTHGWRVDVVDAARHGPSRAQQLVDRWLPDAQRAHVERFGIEGDVMPSVGMSVYRRLKQIRSGVAVVSVPPFSLIAAAAAAVPAAVPLVIDYRDPWSASASPSPLARLTRGFERLALRRAAAVTYAGGDRLAFHLRQDVGIPAERIVSVPNGHDPADTAALGGHEPRDERDGTPLDIVFGGYWYGRNGPGALVDALMKAGPESAKLTVVGGIAPNIREQIERSLPGNLQVTPPIDRKSLYRRLSHADAVIVPLDHGSAVESRIPAKVYDSLATGVPLIALCPEDSAIFSAPGSGRFHHFRQDDAEGLAAFLREAAENRRMLRSGPLGDGHTREESAVLLRKVLEDVTTGRVVP